MISAETLAAVLESVRLEAQEDYVGFWRIPWELRRACPTASDTDITESSLQILHRLAAGDVVFGELSDETGDFVRWDRREALAEVDRAWRRLRRDPDIGDLGYFVVEPGR